MKIEIPESNEYASFFASYINNVSDRDILSYLIDQKKQVMILLGSVSAEKRNYAYQSGKWTVKQLLRHLIDTERMFAFRAMSIARGEKAMLPGFDDEAYVSNACDDDNSFEFMMKEFEVLRDANTHMIKGFSNSALHLMGNANGNQISVRAIVFIIAGHMDHHVQVLKERYLT
jgi:hypothetical protein